MKNIFFIFCLLPSLTLTAGAADKTIVVDAGGRGDFKDLASAIASIPDHNRERVTIHLVPGTYQGPFVVPAAKTNITLEGGTPAQTIITWNHNVKDPIPPGIDKFNPGFKDGANDLICQNLTFQNTSGDHGQAVAFRGDADRVVFRNCRLLGWQDTVFLNIGRYYFKDCHIEGRVDFIYGNATVLFDRCDIHSKNGGYLTAASTPQNQPFGFVFLDCKITGSPDPWTDPAGVLKPKVSNPQAFLGRPWRPYASVSFINCEMGPYVRPEGWFNWGKVSNEATARYSEYGSTGAGGNMDRRVPWAKHLTKEEADKITIQTVLGGKDGWNPGNS